MNVTIENFEAEVVAASMSTPVLVDFWAPWCGPCKSLGPVLEKLEADYGGRFKLAKINSDEQQELAGAFGIRSIPTCVLMMGGKPVDGFMGALPEGQVRQFLDKHVPSEDTLQAQDAAHEAQEHLAAGDAPSARAALEQALATDPGNDDARFDLVQLLISEGELAEAAALLAPTLGRIPPSQRFEALQQWLLALEFVTTDPRGQWSLEKFDELIGQNKRQGLKLLAARMQATATQARACGPELSRHADALMSALQQVGQTTQAAWQTGQPVDALANAVPYMQAFGHTVLAWMWLDVAMASQGTTSADRGRRAACQFFYHYELPKIGAWLQVVANRDRTCADVPEDAF